MINFDLNDQTQKVKVTEYSPLNEMDEDFCLIRIQIRSSHYFDKAFSKKVNLLENKQKSVPQFEFSPTIQVTKIENYYHPEVTLCFSDSPYLPFSPNVNTVLTSKTID